MLQALLADRFKLKVHRETQEHPVLALVVGKNGPKMTESPGDAPPIDTSVTAEGGRDAGGHARWAGADDHGHEERQRNDESGNQRHYYVQRKDAEHDSASYLEEDDDGCTGGHADPG